ncbi:MAG: hypothetical protein PW734_06965 [Verrucomicrobium sp.]|nr:hypothetical protein [Verrucomicrobium sp.]
MNIIQKSIGPSFAEEVLKSSVSGCPFTWDANGVYYADGALTADQVTALNALVSAHDSTKKSAQQVYDEAVAAGFDTGRGYTLACDQSTQSLLANTVSLLNVSLLVATDDAARAAILNSVQTIQDNAGTTHSEKTSDLIPVLVAYGNYCKQLLYALQGS